MKPKIVLIGAGSKSFGYDVLGDIFKSKVLQGSTLVLNDIDALKLRKVEQDAKCYIQEHNLTYALSATTSRQEALQGADFCVISIEVGDRFELWEQDWRIPLQYGNRQIYGENGGPGGLFHSLRIIPPILAICQDIQRICPDAYVFNLSNPMSRICLAVKRQSPELRFVGLCHEIEELPPILSGILNTPFSNLDTKSGGLNHFTILLNVRYKDSGKDAYPEARERALEYFASQPILRERVVDYLATLSDVPEGLKKWNTHLDTPTQPWSDRWLIKEILEKFDYLAFTTDCHFGEYIPWAQEVVDHKNIIDFFLWYKDWSTHHVPQITPKGSDGVERVIPIIEGILSDSHHEEFAVNIPNMGLIDNLPNDLIVEVPAIIDKDGVHGIPLGMFPKGIVGLFNNQVAVQDLTVEAALQSSRKLALQALLVDPVVDSLRGAEQLLEMMIKLQKEYLGYLQ